MIYVKIHKNVIAMCDEDLIGKNFEDETRQLEVSERFYKGELVDEEKIVELLKKGTNLNLFGNNVVAIAIKCGIVKEEEVIEIQGVKHVQIYNID